MFNQYTSGLFCATIKKSICNEVVGNKRIKWYLKWFKTCLQNIIEFQLSLKWYPSNENLSAVEKLIANKISKVINILICILNFVFLNKFNYINDWILNTFILCFNKKKNVILTLLFLINTSFSKSYVIANNY